MAFRWSRGINALLKEEKKTIDNNTTSGSVRQETEFDDEVDQIVRQDDSLYPDYSCSPGKDLKKSEILLRQLHLPTPEPTTPDPFAPGPSSAVYNIQENSSPLSSQSISPAPPSGESLIETPRRNARKTVQEKIFDKYLQMKSKRHVRLDELFLEKLNQKKEIAAEKESKKQKRHQEKMKMLEEIRNKKT